MKYSVNNIRRQDRLLTEDLAIALLKTGEYGVLSMQSENTGAYGLPINFFWDKEHSIYLHCALEGRKIKLIEKCNKVSFCVVGKTKVLSNKFTTEYQSIILDCVASIVTNDEEKTNALKLLILKYSPNDIKIGEKYIQKSFNRTGVIKLTINNWSGKCKAVR